MPSPYRARIDALLAAHTAYLGKHIVVIDLGALIHGIGELIDEVKHETRTDLICETATD
jgi:hypothetical protein